MKRRTFILAAMIVALPALAEEHDSPLVAAAKRSRRLGQRTAVVITNETLAKTGASAHITTTKRQAPLSTARIATPVGAPEKKSEKRPGEASTAALEKKKQAKVPSHDDAEATLDDEDVSADLVSCPNCLKVLEPVPNNLNTTRAVPSASPPHVVAPQPAPTVPARPLESKKNL